MQVWTENPTQLNFGGADVSLFAQLNQRLNSNLVLTKQKTLPKSFFLSHAERVTGEMENGF